MTKFSIVKDRDTKQIGIVLSTKYQTFDEEVGKKGEIKNGAKVRFFNSMLISQYNEECLNELEMLGVLYHIKYIPYYLLLVIINLVLTIFNKIKEVVNGYKSRKRDNPRQEVRRDGENFNRVSTGSETTSYRGRLPSRAERGE